jgi:hypothetical protein
MQFGGLNRGMMTRRSRANHNQFVRRISHLFSTPFAASVRPLGAWTTDIVAPDCDGTIARS